MKVKKIKFEQYRVRGKHRDYEVLVFPWRQYLWAYYDDDDDVFAIDGNPAGYELVKYALAVLIADPDKIIYLPIKDNILEGYFYSERYDAVLTRTELQFRRSEWIKLRRQLNSAHRVENFVLRYDLDRRLAYARRYEKDSEAWRAWKKSAQEFSALCGNTVFITLLRRTCFGALSSIFWAAQEETGDLKHVWDFGWYFTNRWVKHLEKYVKKHSLKVEEGGRI